jgi:beta-galactosidase
MLMEQTPSQQNWQPYNSLKRPGVMRLWSYQAVARGADTVLFFQLRRSIGACEKYHGAVIEHVGHEHTRVFRECADLGKELFGLGDAVLGARVKSKVALLFDWDNWWAVELSSGPTVALKYVNELHKYYDALYRANIAVDVVSVETDLSGYDLVIAPVLYMLKPGVAKRLESYVEAGGALVSTYFSGIVNESDLVTLGGYPGELRKLLGIWAEEIDALLPTQSNKIVLKSPQEGLQTAYGCGMLCDLIHSEGAEVVAEYGEDFYRGMPALTVNRFGKGEAWYVATSPDDAFLQDWLPKLCEARGVEPLLAGAAAGIETSLREKDGTGYLFVLNHDAETASVALGARTGVDMLTGRRISGSAELPGRDLWIIKLDQ